MNQKLHFQDSSGKEGYVAVSDGEYNSNYDGESDAIQRLLQDAKELEVEEKKGTKITPHDKGGEIPEDFVTNVVLIRKDREATAHEKFTHILQQIDILSDVQTSQVTTNSE
ncbi:hypothetical protein [Halorussus halobius]|uniref:hypothetical protein n=1 Tax=Halorussus halobius TaxID=1710537 RepID=UPI00109250A9|nr:hypothetical protein [Halorussus halobius]